MPSAFTSSSDAFESRRDAFESEYFHNKDVQLVEKLKGVFNRKLDREALRKATGISNDEVIDRLLAVNAKGELLLRSGCTRWWRWRGPMASRIRRNAMQ